MKYARYLLILTIIFCLFGCASIQPQIFKFDDQNAATTISSAKQIMKHEKMNSAAIRESLLDFKTQMPVSFWTALDSLDTFAKKYGIDQSAMTEEDASRIVVITGKLLSPVIQQLIKQYAPDLWSEILRWLPKILAMSM